MAPLSIDFIATAAVAAIAGSAGPRSWKSAVALCAVIALVGWAASYVIMLVAPSFGADTELTEDYINGFSAGNAATEIVLALAWTFLWFGLARVTRLILRHGGKSAT